MHCSIHGLCKHRASYAFMFKQQLLHGSSIRPDDVVQLLIETAEAIVLQACITLLFTVYTIVESDGGVLVGRMFIRTPLCMCCIC